MSRLYRIHTEYTEEHQRRAEETVCKSFDSFNIVRGTGYWRGQREESMTIEIIGIGFDEVEVRKVAERIRLLNGQEAVYFTITELDLATLVY